MMNREQLVKEHLSKVIGSMADGALQNTLRKILFSDDQNWDNICDIMVENMPELKMEIEKQEQKESALVAEKLTGEKVPYVGMGATISFGSDCYPYEIVELITAKKIKIRSMDAKRIDKNGLSEDQTYEYTSNPNGVEYIVTLRKDGKWKIEHSKTRVSIGKAMKYMDPSY